MNNKQSVDYKYDPVNQSFKGYRYGTRHMQILLLFCCITIVTLGRGCISVVILAMTDKTIHGEKIPTFEWDKKIQGFILSSFLWGDVFMQGPAGFLISKYGASRFISFMLIINSILTILCPYFSYWGNWHGVCINRILQGLTQGFLYPATHTLLGKWAPVHERNRFGNFAYSGVYIATIVTMPLTAYISGSSLGWPWVFYIYGAMGATMGIVWMFFAANSPAEHSSISDSEKHYIQLSLDQEGQNTHLRTPWRCILTSVPVWALIITQSGVIWGFTVMLSETPTFIKMALNVNLEDSGLLSALPYVAAWITTMISSAIADCLIKRNVTITKIRKVANTVGSWGPAIILIALTYVPAGHVPLAMFIIIMIVGFDGITSTGFLLNHIDLSPNFAGVILSFASIISDAVCLIGPILTGFVVKDPSDIKQWRIIFIITSVIYSISNLVFIFFGSGERQVWDNPTYCENKDQEATELETLSTIKESQPTSNPQKTSEIIS